MLYYSSPSMETDTFSFSAGIFKRKREVDAKQSPGKGIVHFCFVFDNDSFMSQCAHALTLLGPGQSVQYIGGVHISGVVSTFANNIILCLCSLISLYFDLVAL